MSITSERAADCWSISVCLNHSHGPIPPTHFLPHVTIRPLFTKVFLNKRQISSQFSKAHPLYMDRELFMSPFSICTGRCEQELPRWLGGGNHSPGSVQLSRRNQAMNQTSLGWDSRCTPVLKTSWDQGKQAEKWNHSEIRDTCVYPHLTGLQLVRRLLSPFTRELTASTTKIKTA